jgi:hypothetical protein
MNVKSIALVVSILCTCSNAFSQALQQVTYEPDDTNFPNPERGIYHHKEVRSVSYVNLRRDELLRYRNEGATLIMRVFYLESFVDSDISAEYLENMRRDFTLARETGMKLLVRFAYTQKTIRPVGDAEPEWVLAHIEQLKDVLVQNSDVIALVQTGFIGAWGEWYYTDHFSQVIGFINEQNWMDRIAVVNALLDAVPSDRTVQLRMPIYKRRVTGVQEPLTEAEAFSGTDRARLGHHNDCFLASPNDVGTYVNVEEEKNYIENETYFVPLGGETCGVYVPRSECPSALSEMERLHWSYLNVDYHALVINGFETGGCMPDIQTKLGYRYRLTQGEFQTQSAPSGELKLEVELENDGWANPYNPRHVEFVLRHNTSGKEYFFRTTQDPRRWSLSDVIRIEETVGLPATMEEGAYSLYLSLPDPRLSLYGNPNYAIRLANDQVWDATTGYNALNVIVNVDNDNVVAEYSGSDFFIGRNGINHLLKVSPMFSSASATQVLLYWGISEGDGHRVIQRSVDGGPFETRTILQGTQTYFIDEAVEAEASYQYRYYFQYDNEISEFATGSDVDTELSNPDFVNFVSDGVIDEWDVVAPVATRFTDDKTYALRLFADRDSLNVLIEGVTNSTYAVFLNTDENESTGIINEAWAGSGFDYCVRNDSLFQAQGQQWQFVSKVFSTVGARGLEASISLNSLANLGENIRIKTAASLMIAPGVAIQLPFADQYPSTYVRILPAMTPGSLTVSNSEATPESRLVIAWQTECLNCNGFVLERSDNSQSGFSEIFRTSSAKLYRDDNLDVNKTYYYRIYSFNETGKSDYSTVESGTTQSSVTGIERLEHSVKVYPVPVDNILTVRTERRLSSVFIRDALGHVFQPKEVERDELRNEIKIDLSSLAPGVYILWINSGEQKLPRKILKK